MTFQLPTTAEKADYVREQFNRIAGGYDLANDAISLGMHRIWKNRAIDLLNTRPDGQYLDVCCGTADMTLTIAKHLSSEGTVTGLDFSSSMLEVAKERLKKTVGLTAKVNFVQGDAEALPFADNQFDGAIISFGLRNLSHLDKGLSEMRRVVKPGAKVINLDLGRPNNPLFAPIYYFYFRHIVPLIGQCLQNDKKAYTYLPQSLDTYPSPEKISELFKSIGLTEIKHIPLALGSVALHTGIKI